MDRLAAVVLAAGASRRLGEPKQFLLHQGESLIRRTVRAAGEAHFSPVIVVAGSEHERVRTELTGLAAHVHYHPDWEQGIGSSLRAGLNQALDLEPALEGLAVIVCDQPLVTAGILTALINARGQTRSSAAACAYAGTVGVPALFDRVLFPRLERLSGEQGAKSILISMTDTIARVDFPEGAIDIDTPAQRDANLRP